MIPANNLSSQSEIYLKNGISLKNVKIPVISNERNMGDWYKQRFYLNTSDDLNLVTQFYSFKNKNIISVAGAGDFPINFFYAGAKSVQCFDISPQSCFFSELKIAAIKSLNYDSFVEFFYPKKYWARYPQEEKHYSNEIYPFDLKVYDKLKGNISEQARRFFNMAFDRAVSGDYLRVTPNSGIILRRGFSRAKKFNPYLESPKAYEHAQEIINDKYCNFYPISIDDYFDIFNTKSDYVYTSNVLSDQLDKLFIFSYKNLNNNTTKAIGATLFFPYADMNIESELNDKQIQKRVGLSESTWEKMTFSKNKNSITVDNLRIQIFKSVKRTYLEITIK